MSLLHSITTNIDVLLLSCLVLSRPGPVAQLNPMSHTQHCVTSMGAPSWSCSGLEVDEANGSGEQTLDGGEGGMDGRQGIYGEGGLSFLLKQEDTETQDAYIYLYSRLDVALREMKQYVAQIDV